MYHKIEGSINLPSVTFDHEKVSVQGKDYYYEYISSITLSNTIFTSPSGIMHITYKGKEYVHPFNRNKLSKMKYAIGEFEAMRKRQEQEAKQVKEVPVAQPVSNNPYEEIKQLKELLDMGAITQEDYDIKKKQLLNI